MKDYLKNLFAARGAAFWLNLLGLSLAFVIFYVLMAEVMWHVTFDRFHKDADRVCQVFHRNTHFDNIYGSSGQERPEIDTYTAAFMEEIVKSSQQFENYAGIFNLGGLKGYDYIAPSENEDAESLATRIWYCTPDLFSVFTFDLIEGDTAAFRDSHNIFIPLSLARKLFGESDSYIGRQCRVAEQWDVNVGGVYRDFPTNSQMNNDVYQCLNEQQREELWSNHIQWFHNLFVKLRKGADGEKISEELLANSPTLREKASHFTFMPLSDVYYVQNEAYNSHLGSSDYSFGKRNGNRMLVWAFALVALLVIAIAAINYVNFSMAMVPYQIKEINVRRILGAKATSLRCGMMKAAVINVFVAAVLAIVLLKVIIQLGILNGLQNCDLAFGANRDTLLMMLVLIVLLPMIAGSYPAWYLTTRKPALVINGNFALSPKGREFRRGLIAFQFTISIVILQVLLLFSAQQHYVRTAPVGYDRDSVLYVEASKEYERSMENFKWKDYIDPMMQTLKSNPLVSEVAWTGALLGQDMFTLNAINHGDRHIAFNLLEVSDNFLTTMGIDVTEGRNFHPGEKNVVIFNEAARKQLDLKLNDNIVFSGGVIGFVDNFHYKSFRKEITPMAFGVTENVGNKLVVRLNAPERVDEIIRFVNEQNQRISGGRCELTFYTPDRMFGSTYASEMKQLKLLLVGAIVSLLIPLIGVFGLVLFETRAKRKEIGIRKVFGATTRGILVMFNMQYLRTLAMCFIIAAPVAYTLYNKWIESFAYRTPVHWWLFGVAFLIVVIVVCLTVTIQSWRAAKERPVETIMK